MKPYIQLMRIHLSIAIAFSAMTGYLLSARHIDAKAFVVFIAVFLLSGAASAFNQYQERRRDALMERTRNRPLPTGSLSESGAILFAIVIGLIGFFLLLYLSVIAALLGLFNLAWYNLIYTPLKTRTTFAVIIGAITGVVPPVIGWTSAGAAISSPSLIFIAVFMFLWQIPHFVILLMKYGEEYKKAGFKIITNKLNEIDSRVIVFIWIISTTVCSMFFPLFHLITNTPLIYILLIINILIITLFYRILFIKSNNHNINNQALILINAYQLFFFSLLLLNTYLFI